MCFELLKTKTNTLNMIVNSTKILAIIFIPVLSGDKIARGTSDAPFSPILSRYRSQTSQLSQNTLRFILLLLRVK